MAAVIREMNFMRRNLGQVIVASAIIEDSVGWVIIAITFGIAQTRGHSGAALAEDRRRRGSLSDRQLYHRAVLVFRVIRWVNDNFRSEFAVVTAIW